jgi:3-phytase
MKIVYTGKKNKSLQYSSAALVAALLVISIAFNSCEQNQKHGMESNASVKKGVASDTLLRFAVIGDAEPKPNPEFPYLAKTVDHINALAAKQRLDFVAGIGDIPHKGTLVQYEGATKELTRMTLPFYPIMGNEEHGSTVSLFLEYANKWNQGKIAIDSARYVLEKQNMVLVFASPDHGRDFNDSGVVWILDQVRKAAPKPVMLFVHADQAGVYKENPDKGVKNPMFAQVLRQSNLLAVVSGDLHMDVNRTVHAKQIGGVHSIHIPALERTKIPDEGTHKPYFKIFTVRADSVFVQTVESGVEPSQASTQAPNQASNQARHDYNFAIKKDHKSWSILPRVTKIKEAFATVRDEKNNVDSPALWHSQDGKNWMLATAKETDMVIVYDAATGDTISRFGTSGAGLGELSRPNGIAIIDSLAIVVERDNHRVQVFSLPQGKSLGYFAQDYLKKPYGIAVEKVNGMYRMYITDNYENSDEEIPAADSLGQRVHVFEVHVAGDKDSTGQVQATHIKAFGDTQGAGVLYKVESILVDRAHNRLLIADEYEKQRNVKVYTLDGTFTGTVIPNDYFLYEPEGIVLWECPKDSSGYYIVVDQGKIVNTFQVFERKSMQYLGGFAGEITMNTDGVALTQKSFGNFAYGAFYPVHDDGSVTAIGWEEIANTLHLRKQCGE